jgi:hypothetical protein
MGSRIAEARHELWLAMTVDPTAPLTVARIHEWAPDQVVAPCIYIGTPTLDRTTVGSPGASIVMAGFPVYCVADGSPMQQSKALDELVALVWDATFAAGGLPDASRPATVDVGGPTLRGVVVQSDMILRAVTLCTPSLEGATSG